MFEQIEHLSNVEFGNRTRCVKSFVFFLCGTKELLCVSVLCVCVCVYVCGLTRMHMCVCSYIFLPAFNLIFLSLVNIFKLCWCIKFYSTENKTVVALGKKSKETKTHLQPQQIFPKFLLRLIVFILSFYLCSSWDAAPHWRVVQLRTPSLVWCCC